MKKTKNLINDKLTFKRALKKVSLTVLILNYKNPKDTIDCLKSLLDSTVSFNILLIDNGSGDDSASQIKRHFPKLNIVEFKENYGFTGGNNRGLKLIYQSPTKYVLLLNNDMVVEKNMIEILVEELENNPKAGAISPLVYYFGLTVPWYAGGRISYFKTGGGINYETSPLTNETQIVEFATAGVVMARTDLIKKIGGFDDRFFAYHEDDDLFVKIAKEHYQILFASRALAHHRVNTTLGKRSALQVYYDTRNKLLFMCKWGKWYHFPSFIAYLIYKNFIWNLAGAILKPGPKKFSRLKGFVFGVVDFLQNKLGKTQRNL